MSSPIKFEASRIRILYFSKSSSFNELEMLYNQTIGDTKQDYQINDFVGDLNKIYLAINASTSYLKIITTFNEDSSEIIKILIKSS